MPAWPNPVAARQQAASIPGDPLPLRPHAPPTTNTHTQNTVQPQRPRPTHRSTAHQCSSCPSPFPSPPPPPPPSPAPSSPHTGHWACADPSPSPCPPPPPWQCRPLHQLHPPAHQLVRRLPGLAGPPRQPLRSAAHGRTPPALARHLQRLAGRVAGGRGPLHGNKGAPARNRVRARVYVCVRACARTHFVFTCTCARAFVRVRVCQCLFVEM